MKIKKYLSCHHLVFSEWAFHSSSLSRYNTMEPCWWLRIIKVLGMPLPLGFSSFSWVVAAFWKLSKHYLLYAELNHIFYIPVSSAARYLLCIQYIHIVIWVYTPVCLLYYLLLALLMTSCARVETNHTRGDQKHGARLICHVGRQQKAALHKAEKYPSNIHVQ